jgi:hypothetical protein
MVGIRILKFLIASQFFAVNVLFAQSELSNKYCENTDAIRITESSGKFLSDSLYVTYVEDATGLTFKVVNTTDKSVYLFSSYFPEMFHSSKYIHRLNKKDKTYRVSFLPLIPYLSTKPTDKIILGSDRIISKGQVLYNFVKMLPQTYHEIKVSYDNLFMNVEKENNLTCDFEASEKGKFDKIKFKNLSTDKLKGKYKLFFEFATYYQVDVLCSQAAYYLNEFEFDKQAKSFRKLSVPLKIQNYDHPLF